MVRVSLITKIRIQDPPFPQVHGSPSYFFSDSDLTFECYIEISSIPVATAPDNPNKLTHIKINWEVPENGSGSLHKNMLELEN